MTRLICEDCGNILTDEERRYYAGRCEGCEVAWHDRIKAWRRGADDPMFDAALSVPKPGLH